MYERMLVPLDGSELAEVVFPYAKELSGRLNLDIVFLHVCSPEEHAFKAMHRAYVERAADIIRRQSEEVQRRTGIQQGDKPIEVRGELAEGHPADEIIRYANENKIDFVLIATHGYSGIKRWVLGSVADKVLRASRVPVWLARAGIPNEIVYDKWPKRTALVLLDGSQLAESVLPHIEALVKQRGAELVDVVLLRVCEPSFISADYPEASMRLSWEEHFKRITDHYREISRQYLMGVEKRLKDAGIRVQFEVLMGNPADEIINYASKNPFNLVVMSTHGHSGLDRWVYGSVADKIVHGVTSPIFLVRPR